MNRRRKRVPLREPRFITRISVRVSTLHGALEMMRYDSCYPATEADTQALMRVALGRGDEVVTFVRAARNDRPPTIDRWRSRGCEVLKYDSPNWEGWQ